MSFDDVARRMKGRDRSSAHQPVMVTGESQFGLAMIAAQQRNRTQRRITITALLVFVGAALAFVMQN